MPKPPAKKSVIPGWNASADAAAPPPSTDASPPAVAPERKTVPKAGTSAKPKRQRFVRVDPDEEELRPKPFLQRLREDLENGFSGLTVSLAIHMVVLFVFGFIIMNRRGRAERVELQASWLRPITTKAQQQGGGGEEVKGVPLAINSDVGDVRTLNLPKNDEQPTMRGPGDLADPVDVAGLLKARDTQVRASLPDEFGNSQQVQNALTLGFGWLLRTQNGDGSWSLSEGYPDPGSPFLKTRTGATSLALLCFLGDGHTHVTGKYPEAVKKGLDWLLGIQQASGNLHDSVEEGKQTSFYAHAQGTIVLCEAYAMTGDDRLREPAERAVGFLVRSQQPIDGGWKYRIQDQRSHGDLSVTGWGLMALHIARVAGIDVDDTAFDLGMRFLDTVQTEDGLRYKYEPTDPDSRASHALTAEGLLCRQFLGWPADHERMRQGIDLLTADDAKPLWEAGRRNVYHWYYATHFFHNLGGEPWRTWYASVQKEIFDHQISSGSGTLRGSWSPYVRKGRGRGSAAYGDPHEYANLGGRLYVTCMCLLTLEAPYRYQSLYKPQ